MPKPSSSNRFPSMDLRALGERARAEGHELMRRRMEKKPREEREAFPRRRKSATEKTWQ